MRRWIQCLFGLALFAQGGGAAAVFAPEQMEFFETRVRPVLVDRCYSCHSDRATKVKGGLRLDTRAGVLKGGDTGPALVPGAPQTSLLIRAVNGADKGLQMPPEGGKLTAAQIEALVAWVKMGAPDPRQSAGPAPLTDIGAARARHWAFQPVVKPAVPAVRKKGWVRTPLDAFILSQLEKKGIRPAPPADRRALIRRASYDLTGLPPTAQEVELFVHDLRPEAYGELVDRLLASPRYGERWGRHWLDIARYADTKGYLPGGEQRRFSFSHTYRDYVIRAFNEDKPYDQFLIEQIAADRLPLGEDKSALAGLGFLTLGRRFLDNQNDIIDDRIDVVTRGTLGLTVSCARCHDHKFDPIPAKDYYALHGVFASSEEPGERPLLGPLRDTADYRDYLKEKAAIEEEIGVFEEKEIERFLGGLRQHVGDYLLAARAADRLTNQSKFDDLAGQNKTLPSLLRRWMADLQTRRKGFDPVFAPWFALADRPEDVFPSNTVAGLIGIITLTNRINPLLLQALSNTPPASVPDLARVYNGLFKDVDAEWEKVRGAGKTERKPAVLRLPDAGQEALRQVLLAENAPANPPKSEVRQLHSRRLGEGAAPMRNRIAALSWTHRGAPPRAMVLVDRAQPHDSPVFKRGNPGNPGEIAPRRFLTVLGGAEQPAFTNGSGRLELARAIASPANPLTARVFVNRVWREHFGEGLVSTAGDFGVRTEVPVQRELLDYMAAVFMEGGWQIKSLHRLIMLSSMYQQSCEGTGRAVRLDPGNRYYGRMQLRRLDFESLRDTLLAVTGELDLRMGGPAVDLFTPPYPGRRAVYGLIDRQNLPGLLRTFDFANPDTSNQGRFQTTVPQQALFLMNSPFVGERAGSLAQSNAVWTESDRAQTVRRLYQAVFQRAPGAEELRLGVRYLAGQKKSGGTLQPLEKYAQALLLSNELVFVD